MGGWADEWVEWYVGRWTSRRLTKLEAAASGLWGLCGWLHQRLECCDWWPGGGAGSTKNDFMLHRRDTILQSPQSCLIARKRACGNGVNGLVLTLQTMLRELPLQEALRFITCVRIT